MWANSDDSPIVLPLPIPPSVLSMCSPACMNQLRWLSTYMLQDKLSLPTFWTIKDMRHCFRWMIVRWRAFGKGRLTHRSWRLSLCRDAPRRTPGRDDCRICLYYTPSSERPWRTHSCQAPHAHQNCCKWLSSRLPTTRCRHAPSRGPKKTTPLRKENPCSYIRGDYDQNKGGQLWTQLTCGCLQADTLTVGALALLVVALYSGLVHAVEVQSVHVTYRFWATVYFL